MVCVMKIPRKSNCGGDYGVVNLLRMGYSMSLNALSSGRVCFTADIMRSEPLLSLV